MMNHMEMDMENWDDSLFESFNTESEMKKLVIILIDASSSMEGTKIAQVNGIMEELIYNLDSPEIYIATAVISSEVSWNANKPVSSDSLNSWNRVKAEFLSHLGQGFRELHERLKTPGWSADRADQNYFILFSDGYGTDACEDDLQDLVKDENFRKGARYAFYLGDRMDEDILCTFTGKRTSVMKIKTSEAAVQKITSVIREC